MRIAEGKPYLKNGQGYSLEELRELVQNSRDSEMGIDDLVGDLAIGADIIEGLLDKIDNLNETIRSMNEAK
ncbi:hypothetical protein BN7874_072 [Phage NCTB]|nr:hypothetical protein BN7874_072 [Phage NCTB]